MNVPYTAYTAINAPVIIDRNLGPDENMQITLIAGDPDGDILNITISGCPSALSPNLEVSKVDYTDIPIDLLNGYYDWLNEQPNTAFKKFVYSITGNISAVGNHVILFQINDGRGGENWVRANINIVVENSVPYLHGCIVAEE